MQLLEKYRKLRDDALAEPNPAFWTYKEITSWLEHIGIGDVERIKGYVHRNMERYEVGGRVWNMYNTFLRELNELD